MRLRGKIDRNQPEIVRALRQIGASVQSLANVGDGCPDLLVALGDRVVLMEIKDGLQPPSKRRLTDDEKAWHDSWAGDVAVIETVEEALREIKK